jgi:hypothetical protein
MHLVPGVGGRQWAVDPAAGAVRSSYRAYELSMALPQSAIPRGNPQVQISRRKLQNCRFQLEKISFLLSAVCF